MTNMKNNPMHPKGRNGFRVAEYADPFGRAGSVAVAVGTKSSCRRAMEMTPGWPGHAG
jgi:hypothetical protein